jgi:CheY-like chemotaxis protein
MADQGHSVLCVDDDEAILKSLERLLSLAGYRVFSASSGVAGLQIVARESVDVIIADQRMPVMSGSEFLRVVRQSHPGIISIMLSGYTDFDSLISAVNDGEIYRFVPKPWDNDVLLGLVSSALEKRRVKEAAQVLAGAGIGDSALSGRAGVHIKTADTERGSSIRILEDGKALTGETLIDLLEIVFKALEINDDARIKIVSASLKDKGKVALFINLGQGMMLDIEIPKV